ncbi:uncharacterized protein LOC114580475 [Dendrobium catenatum]|uniref:uncharacterized protein LOC114580475 n=1 Tax=Dendrobium catenatum TaxID=906689 RepID=UPI00109F3DDE|nr:uncharacterized protein LOC114580475 [Dendrobium catenatum]
MDADSLELIKSPLGTSILAICYDSLFRCEENQVCTILKLGLRPRESIFWWRVYMDLIPMCGWLHRRGLCADVLCPMGCNQLEELNHVTTQCKKLDEVLRRLEAWGFPTPRFTSLDELKGALKGGLLTKASWPLLYCAAVHLCWGNRNAIRHGKNESTITMMAAKILGSTTHSFFSRNLEQRFTKWALSSGTACAS